ncbi:hypothetical protein [Kineococcus rhizosphaerae]|uniref:HicB-like protein involved in pilus formation n=1 Tax=Kineococcus rhizosphaerae TaxID=559628 RepID=A0A2T0R5U1_9ACTN|nr:hypothetical protein [Kineococcus rhizosphaerae]PRY16097.1 hypothetical protein CLV37_104315 [Kineococcus rhizosphaerae]
MDLLPYVVRLRQDLATTAESGSEEVAAAAERLVATLDPSVRLLLLDALVEAAGELTSGIARSPQPPSGVEVRLRGREVEFVLTTSDGAPVATPGVPGGVNGDVTGDVAGDDGDVDGGTSRLSLRVPDRLKSRIERAADADGVSVNAWLVRSIGEVLDGAVPRTPPAAGWNPGGWAQPPAPGGDRRTGWAR